jgi:hypothetical protein
MKGEVWQVEWLIDHMHSKLVFAITDLYRVPGC